jgi:hypothetical protein
MPNDNDLSPLDKKILPFLDKDEKIISSGTFETRISVIDRPMDAGFSDLANRNHIIGVTDKRVIVLPLERITGMPVENEILSVDFADVKIENDGLLINSPSFEKPFKYSYAYGYKVSKDQFSIFYPDFLDAIEKGKKRS